MRGRAASKPSSRLLDPPSPRDDAERAAWVDNWLDQLCIEMDELTKLAEVVADRAGETVPGPGRDHLRLVERAMHRTPKS